MYNMPVFHLHRCEEHGKRPGHPGKHPNRPCIREPHTTHPTRPTATTRPTRSTSTTGPTRLPSTRPTRPTSTTRPSSTNSTSA